MNSQVRTGLSFVAGVVMAGTSALLFWQDDEPVERPPSPTAAPTPTPGAPTPDVGISPERILRIPSEPMVNRVEETRHSSTTRQIVPEPTRTPRPEPTTNPPEDAPDIELPDVPDIEIPDVDLPDLPEPLPDIDLPDLPKLP